MKIQFFFWLNEYLPNSLTMLEIGLKSFGNHWPCLEVVENLSTPSVIFGSGREIFGDLRESSEIFANLRKPSVNLMKFRFCGDEKSHAFY